MTLESFIVPFFSQRTTKYRFLCIKQTLNNEHQGTCKYRTPQEFLLQM